MSSPRSRNRTASPVNPHPSTVSRFAPNRLTALGTLLGLALAAWGLWWLAGRALHFYGNLDHPLRASLLTALVCCALLALASARRDRVRCARFQRRAETYEAALAAILRGETTADKEWQSIRARLLLWGSADVIELALDLDRQPPPVDLTQAHNTAIFTDLVRTMRRELGQGDVAIEFSPVPSTSDRTR